MLINKSSLKHYFDFLLAMTEKEIKARYKKAIMGFLWVVLNPFFQMIIIGLVFSFFINIPNYFIFLFSGLLPWQFFSLSLSKTTPSFVFERNLLKKAEFPKEAIPISIIFSNFFHLLVSTFIFIIFLIFTHRLITFKIFLVIPIFLWLLIFTIGISLLTSSLQVRFRDINFFTQSLLTLWFYATPILYNLVSIPNNLHQYFAINPLTSIFELLHIAFLNQGLIDYHVLTFNILITLIIITSGIIIFQKQKQYFVDWL